MVGGGLAESHSEVGAGDALREGSAQQPGREERAGAIGGHE